MYSAKRCLEVDVVEGAERRGLDYDPELFDPHEGLRQVPVWATICFPLLVKNMSSPRQGGSEPLQHFHRVYACR